MLTWRTGSAKLDNYQNFAKAFHVEGLRPRDGHAPQPRTPEARERIRPREPTDATEIGASRLGRFDHRLAATAEGHRGADHRRDQMRGEMVDFRSSSCQLTC